MRRFYISEMDEHGLELARSREMGLELIAFCAPENMESAAFVEKVREGISGISDVSLHAPYYEIAPCAIDPLIREVAMKRFVQAMDVCKSLGADRMIVHSGYAPQVYFPEWFVPQSIEFWRAFAARMPENFNLMIENVLDVSPEHIAAVCDGIGDGRVKICLDVGHANAYSNVPVEEWIRFLGARIGHVHLHNNYGDYDAHASLDAGSMDIPGLLALLDAYAPEAAICIESRDALRCLRELKEKGYIP